MSAREAKGIVHAYGGVLASVEELAIVSDETLLRHPKQRIKEALLVCLRSTDDAESRDAMLHGYFMLASFQPGVGASGLGPTPMPQASAQEVLAWSQKALRFNDAITLETQALTDELHQELERDPW